MKRVKVLSDKLTQQKTSIFDGSGEAIENIPLETIDVDYEDIDFKKEYKERLKNKDRVCQLMEDEGLYNDTLFEEIDNETLAEHHLRLVVGKLQVVIFIPFNLFIRRREASNLVLRAPKSRMYKLEANDAAADSPRHFWPNESRGH